MHEHAEGPAAKALRQHPGTRTDAPLPAKGLGARACAHAAFRNGAPLGGLQRFPHVAGPHRVGPHVIHPAVVRFPNDGVDGVLPHARLVVKPVHEAPGGAPDAKGAGEDDRRLQLPKLSHLRLSDELAVAVTHVNPGGHGVGVEVAGARDNGGHAGADAVPLDEGFVPHLHPGHIREGV